MDVASDIAAADAAMQVVERLEARFRAIAAERMADVPILNPVLGVKATSPREINQHWLCALVTPWFLNLVLLPSSDAAPLPATVGAKHIVSLPAGAFEFIVSHDEALGTFAMCSLFSPMFEFVDQETADVAATAALAAAMEAKRPDEEEDEDEDMVRLWRGEGPESDKADATQRAADQPANDVDDVERRDAALTRRGLLFGRRDGGGRP